MIERLLKLASILENTDASVEDLLDCYVMISTAASKNEPNDPELWSRAKAAAKKKFKVYPSAYANAWAAKWYKEKGGTWSKKKKNSKAEDQENAVHEDSGLGKWFNKEKWVDISRKDKSGKHPECGRSKAKSGKYPKCRPKAEADRMSKKEKESATRQKRDAERKNPKKGKGNKPTWESHKKRD